MASTNTVKIKQVLKTVLPVSLMNWRKRYLEQKTRTRYRNLTTKEVFTKIYEEGAWGELDGTVGRYCSGSGSHDPLIVDPYVSTISQFLASFGHKPDVVDLGCGDFAVGSKIRHACGKYIGCDIVELVIASNKERYKLLDVDFRTLDLTRDMLPEGEIVFLRQVLQHLSNAKISTALPGITSNYEYVILTEHLPAGAFSHNADKPSGPDTRLILNSGVVLTSPPFNLVVKEEKILCEVYEYGGIVRTILYRL